MSAAAQVVAGPTEGGLLYGTRSIEDYLRSESLPRGGARQETLWIFEADFEDTTSPGNTGWISLDLSGYTGNTNYWHLDTFNAYGDTGHSWRCGAYNHCWSTPYGYGNNWRCSLEHDFDFAPYSESVVLDFRQKLAMEHDEDFGYIDVSTDGAMTWTTLGQVTNPGFAGKPGIPQDWDSPTHGHWETDLSAFAGHGGVTLRFRFESNDALSAEDCAGDQCNAVAEGAWYLDEITITADGEVMFYDNCENGQGDWRYEDVPPSGQTGVVFRRMQLEFSNPCGGGPDAWGYAAVDTSTGIMVNGQYSVLISPALNISGADAIVASWDMWLDTPPGANDFFDLWLAAGDDPECIKDLSAFVDSGVGPWYGGPFWGTWTDDWSAFAGNDWLRIMWREWNEQPVPPSVHGPGMFLDRQRVGVVTGGSSVGWSYSGWDRWHDTFDPEEVLSDTLCLGVEGPNGVDDVYVVAISSNWDEWQSFPMTQQGTSSTWCIATPPQLAQAHSEIWYYFRAVDEFGNESTFPEDAPREFFEFSILPLYATVSDPGILLVDKHGRRVPGEERNYRRYSEYYYYEPLEILGYDFEVYDVEVPSGSTDQSNGPDSAGYKFYDTQIWFTSDMSAYTIKVIDQLNLIQWLAQSPEKERNLLISGNDFAWELAATGLDSLNLLDVWLGVEFLENDAGDTMPILRPAGPQWGSWECILAGGCPLPLMTFDVIEPRTALPGAELATEYELPDRSTKPSGVAYTHAALDYQAVTLGFGLEFMMDSLLPNGHFVTGIRERVEFMDEIMSYFGKEPTGLPTNVAVTEARDALSHAYPNPFNPVTEIEYSVREKGLVTISVHNVAGRVVRTLLDAELDAGASGHVVWDGSNESGERCASGVYFYRIQAPAFADTKKMLMLK